MEVRKHRRARWLAGILAAQILLWQVVPAYALPKGEQVRNGTVTFNRTDGVLEVRQETGKAIVNYDSFNIDAAETVRFIQPGSASAILNRVDSDNASTIAGTMTANGYVYLINPYGILFSSTARINVGGLVASALSMNNADFLADKLVFGNGIGSVVNKGSISAKAVYLIGPRVRNEGSIKSDNAILAAADGAIEIDRANGGIIRLITDDSAETPPMDTPQEDGELMDVEQPDEIDWMVAAPEAEESEATETASEQAAPESGTSESEQTVLAPGTVINDGIIDTSGESGGSVFMYGDSVGQLGRVDASGLLQDGGSITIYGIDTVALGPDSITAANAGINGDGGDILILSPDTALFRQGAKIEAKGGEESGDGGEVEVSGYKHVEAFGLSDTSAKNGKAGTYLIDPADVYIRNVAALGDGTWTGTDTFTPNTVDAVVPVSVLAANLARNDVTITTTDVPPGAPVGQPGNITIEDALVLAGTGNNLLTLHANNNILVNAAITFSDPLGAASPRLQISAANVVTVNSPIDTAGGTITISTAGAGPNTVNLNSTISTGGGNFSSQGIDFSLGSAASLATAGGSVSLAAHTGNVTIDSAIDTSDSAGGTIQIAGSLITLGADLDTDGGDITLWNNVSLDDNIQINTGGGSAGNITFAGTIDADAAVNSRRFDLEAGTGIIDFQDSIGSTEALEQLDVSSASELRIGNLTLRRDGMDVIADTITLSGNISTDADASSRAGGVVLDGAVVLAGNVQIDTDHATGLDAAVTFESTVNADAIGNSRSLQITAGSEDIEFNGAVGSAAPIESLAVVSAGVTELGDVTTRDGGVDVTSSTHTELSGDISTDGNAAGNAGNVSLSGPVTLTADTTINTDHATGADGNITLNGATDADAAANNRTLQLIAGDSAIDIQQQIGSSERPWQVSANGGPITVSAAITVNDLVTLTGSGDVTFDARVTATRMTVNSANDILVNFEQSIGTTLAMTAGTDGSGGVTVGPGANLQMINIGSSVSIASGSASGNVNLQANVTATDLITLSSPAGTLSLSAGSTVRADAVRLSANDADLLGTVNGLSTTITDADGTGIGLGGTAVAGGLNISGIELQNVSALLLELESAGNITVDGISTVHSANAGAVTLDSASGISFINNASTFDVLTVEADNGITVSTDVSTDTGSMALDGDDDNAVDGADSIVLANGSSLNSAGLLTLDATSGGISGPGSTSLTANNGITINDDFTIQDTLTADADNNPGDDSGAFTVAAGMTLQSTAGNLDITADTFNLQGSLNAVAGNITITEADGTGIGFGDSAVSGGLRIDRSELQRMSAAAGQLNLATAGDIMVDNIQPGEANGFPLVNMNAGDSITFGTGDSTFNALTAYADNGITVNVDDDVTTVSGQLLLDADANNTPDGNDQLVIQSAVTLDSADSLTLKATSGGISFPGVTTLTADNGISVLSTVSGFGRATIDADNDDNSIGTFTVAAGTTFNNNDNEILLTTADIDLQGSLSGTWIGIFDSDPTGADGVGLGSTPAAGGINISGAELGRITTDSLLTLNTAGSVTIDGITQVQSDNVNDVNITADDVSVLNSASTFDSLSLQAADGIDIGADLATSVGDLVLEGDSNNSADGDDAIAFSSHVQLTAENTLTLDATSGGISGSTALDLIANNGVTINDDLTTGLVVPFNAGLTIDADADDTGGGTLTIAAGADVSTSMQPLNITANDLVLLGTLTAAATVIEDSDDDGLGLGDSAVASGLHISAAELANMTVASLELITEGNLNVDNISASDSDNANQVTLTSGGLISFLNIESTFDSLIANADDGILVDFDLTTDEGNLVLDGDADGIVGTRDNIEISHAMVIDSAGSLSVSALNGGISIPGIATMLANDGVTFFSGVVPPSPIGTVADLTIDADVDNAGGGTFNVTAPTFDIGQGTLNVTADDVALAGTLSAGTIVFSDSDGSGIGLGATPTAGGLNISGTELQNTTADSLTLNSDGTINVDSITEAQSDSAGSVALDSSADIAFINGASTFDSLDARADNGIAVNFDITADEGDLYLDADENLLSDGVDSMQVAAGIQLTSAGGATVSAAGGDIAAAGALTVNAADGVTVNDALTAAGAVTIDADTDVDGNGTLTLGLLADIDTGANALDITAADALLQANINAGAATVTDSDGSGIGLGDNLVAGNLNLDQGEIQGMTVASLALNTAGSVTADNLAETDTDNLNGVTIDADGSVSFNTAASTFDSLAVHADNRIAVNTDVTTDEGAMSLDGDANNTRDGQDDIRFGAGVQLAAAGDITIEATSGDMSGAGAVTFTPGGADQNVNVNDPLSTAGDQSYQGNLVAANSVRLDSGRDITVADGFDVTSQGDLAMYADGNLTLGGDLIGNGDVDLRADSDGSLAGQLMIKGDASTAGAVPAGFLTLVGDLQIAGDMMVGDHDMSLYGADRNEIDYTIEEPIRAGGVEIRMGHDILDGTTAEDTLIQAGTVRLTARTGSIGGSGKADLDIDSGTLTASARGNAYLEEKNNTRIAGEVKAGGKLDFVVHGTVSGKKASAGGEMIIDARSDILIDSLSSGDEMRLTGRDLKFDEMNAGSVDADMSGTIRAGKANVDRLVDFAAGGSILDNNSMITAEDVIMKAGGNIGGAPIQLNVDRITEISADGLVHITQHHSGHTQVGLISAGTHFDVKVPNGGLSDGNDSSLNFGARDDSYLSLHDSCGGLCNALEIDISAGNLTVDAIDLVKGDHENDWTWIGLDGTINSGSDPKITYIGAGDVPGLIVLNDNVVGGGLSAIGSVNRTRAFAVETPQIRSKQGIFGSPYFIHTYMQVDEPIALGLIDYILYGQAEITADPEFTREAKRLISMRPEGYIW